MSICNLCPRKCNIDRSIRDGYCLANDKIKIARAAPHFWEEPSLSYENGSGAVFFSGCNLKCIYCQNHNISSENFGIEIDLDRLITIFFELKEKGCHNINLITPTHYIDKIKVAIEKSKKQGFDLPFVYNSSGYDDVESLRMLDGLIDIYLPDFKYFSSILSKKYSLAQNYPDIAKKAIDEMFRQVGKNIFDGELLKKGVIVRHLVLPGNILNSKNVLKYLYEKYKDDIYISIMGQYTPMGKLPFDELNRKLTQKEYDSIVDYAIKIGIKNAYIQDLETADSSFIPEFDTTGVLSK